MNKKILIITLGMIFLIGMVVGGTGLITFLSEEKILPIKDIDLLTKYDITDYELEVMVLDDRTEVKIQDFGMGKTIRHNAWTCTYDENRTRSCEDIPKTQEQIDNEIKQFEDDSIARMIEIKTIIDAREEEPKEITEVTLKSDKIVVIAK